MKNSLSNKEKFILLILFFGLILIYYIFGLFQSTINPIIRLLPFIAIGIYVFIKNYLKVWKTKRIIPYVKRWFL